MELRATCFSATIKRCPQRISTLLAIAALGGHLKRNGEPGWLTLARGYERLMTLTWGWNLCKEAEK